MVAPTTPIALPAAAAAEEELISPDENIVEKERDSLDPTSQPYNMELKWTGQCNPTCNRGLACIELHVDLPCDSASASSSAVPDVVVRFAMVSPE